MARTRQQVKNFRTAALGGILGGIALTLFTRLILEGFDGNSLVAQRSMFFGDPNKWPAFFHGFWPLDLVFNSLYFGYVMYFITANIGKPNEDSDVSFLDYVKYIAGFVLIGGCMGGIFGTSLFGWTTGFDGFVIFGLFVLAFCVVITIIAIAGMFAAPYAAMFGKAVHDRFMASPLAGPADRFKRVMNAEDIPDNGNSR